MNPEYNPEKIEKSAQETWLKEERFKAKKDNRKNNRTNIKRFKRDKKQI